MGIYVIVLLIAVIALVVWVIKSGYGRTLCTVFGVLALVGGGVGYFVADGKLNHADFRWDHYGSSTYNSMVDLRNIGQYAMIIGVLLIIVGVILYAVSVSKCSTNADRSPSTVVRKTTAQPRQVADRYCVNCRQPLAANGRFCPHCGTENIPVERRCVCGALLDENAKFCPECGAKNEQ